MRKFVGYCKENKIYICIGLMLLYVLPVIVNGVPYVDDVVRINSGMSWNHDGRLATTLVMRILSLGHRILNTSPLPLIISIFLLSLSSYYFCYKTNINKLIPILCISSGIIISPFYLENISYLFDILGMSCAVSLGIFTGVYAAFNRINILNCLIIFLGTFVSLLFYQSSINAFFIIFIFCLYLRVDTKNINEVLINFVIITVILIIALLINSWITHFYLSGWLKSRSEILSVFSFQEIFKNYKYFLSFFLGAFKNLYGVLCGLVLIISLFMLFTKGNKLQKIIFPFLLVVILFFVSGPFIILKEPVIKARFFLSLNAIYLCIIYILFTQKNKIYYYIVLFFLFIHLTQAYYVFNCVKNQNIIDMNILNSYSKSIKNVSSPIEKFFVIGNINQSDKYGHQYPIAKEIAVSYANYGWHTSSRLELFGIKLIPNLDFSISKQELSNCNNIIEFNQFYNVLIKEKTIIFDFDRNCPTHSIYILNQLNSKNKKMLNKKFPNNFVLVSLMPYKVSLVNNLIFEFNKSLYEQAKKDDDIFYIHFFEKGKYSYINEYVNLNNQVKMDNKYYLLTSTNSVQFDRIEKIRFGFYNSKTRVNSSEYEIYLN